LEELARGAVDGSWRRHLLPLDAGLDALERLMLTEEEKRRIVQGQSIDRSEAGSARLARAYSREGQLLAIVEFDDDALCWRPKKVFGQVGEAHVDGV
jgi:tRNA U55 pseudouridine synthase TruB